MKLFKFLLLLFFLFSIKGFAQLPEGGTSISGFLCSQGQVYAWGLNKQGVSGSSITGTLGTGSISQNINLPKQVIFPASINIKSIGGISGGYFLAIDCSGKVWGWGDNGEGQLGLGNKISQTAPQKVLVQAGSTVDLAGFRDPVTGQLQKINKVYAGNASSLALTDDGRLLSWGCNGQSCDPSSPGILGNGTFTDAPFPTFVLDGATNQPLQNVIDISISDNFAIALVDEKQEGLGFGTVYTWGNGNYGTLGRNASGTGNSGNETTASNVARPARLIGGPAGDGYLRYIKSIATGAVAGYALDINGYVWAWGNGGWGGTTGQGQVFTHSDPRRVVKGDASNGGTDGTYLLAKSIAAGLGFAMAVTLDGMPVAWGNNSCSTNPAGPGYAPIYACGGNLGNGGVGTQSTVPKFILNGFGSVHNDVRTISSGDFWGYYLREDNSIWAWGDNIVGQLGTGGYTTQNRAVPLPQIASGCFTADPIPVTDIAPIDTTVCGSKLSSNPIILSSGMKLSPYTSNYYEFTWYRVSDPNSPIFSSDTSFGNIVKKGFGQSYSTYSASLTGRYWVRLRYMGPNSPCGGYQIAYDYTTVKAYPNSFNTKSNLTYCNNEAVVSVSSLNSYPAGYEWFATLNTQTPLGKSIGSGNTTIDASIVPTSGNGDKTVYVEEKYSGAGTVIPIQPSSTYYKYVASHIAGTSSNTSGNDMYFWVGTDVRIDTVSLYAKTFNTFLETANFQIKIFGTTLDCGGRTIANRSVIIGNGLNYITKIDSSATLVKIPVNISLKGGQFYFLGLNTNLNGTIRFYTDVAGITNAIEALDLSGNSPKVDNISGNIIKVYGTDDGSCLPITPGIFGSFFHWKFSTLQNYCDRKPVVLKPCVVTGNVGNETIANGFKLYPNPSNSFFNLASPETSHIRVMDFNGKEIENRTINGTEQIGENWASGIYVLLVNTGNISHSYKLSKVR